MLLPVAREPAVDDALERRRVDVVELVAALASCLDQAGGLEQLEVLRDRLAGRSEPVLGRQARAELEQPLPVPLGQLVEDRAARRVGQGLGEVRHTGGLYASIYLPVKPGARSASTRGSSRTSPDPGWRCTRRRRTGRRSPCRRRRPGTSPSGS